MHTCSIGLRRCPPRGDRAVHRWRDRAIPLRDLDRHGDPRPVSGRFRSQARPQ